MELSRMTIYQTLYATKKNRSKTVIYSLDSLNGVFSENSIHMLTDCCRAKCCDVWWQYSGNKHGWVCIGKHHCS